MTPVTTLAASDFVAFGVLATIVLINLLIIKELASAAVISLEERGNYDAAFGLKKLSFNINALIVPLLIIFSLIMATKIIEVL